MILRGKIDHQPFTRLVSAAAFLAATVSLLGCGGSEPAEPVQVKGQVTVSGKAIEMGEIAFAPIEGLVGPVLKAKIANGEYFVDPQQQGLPGKYAVTFSGKKRTGKKIPYPEYPGTLVDELVKMVPNRFEKKAMLKQELKAGVNSGINFDLPPRTAEDEEEDKRRMASG